ncbi:DEAD/DEAH box helicase, partial [bacterium]|nr:DEAD/DEAH box helicase [bacterium]
MESVNESVVESSVGPSFLDLGVPQVFANHLLTIGFKEPTDIQRSSIPELLKQTRDFIGMASTGTGKTGAFAIPLIEKIEEGVKKPQALVLCPTRELAQQVAGQIEKMGQFRRIKVALIYGGSSYQTQIRALKSGAQIVVATPGRLIDLMEQGLLHLDQIQNLVLDEADEMLSMGFQDALNTILKAIQKQRTENEEQRIWLFSATMSQEIQRITDKYLKNPIVVKKTTGKQVTTDIEQSYILAGSNDKLEVLKRILMKHNNFYGLIFCQTRGEADDLASYLNKMNFRTEAMHGDKSQNERERILEQFRKRHVQIVTATDVAARGIDVKDLTHVVNWSLPWDVEIYIHRIGRTGRNGQKGIAVSLVNPSQMGLLRRIEKVTRQPMTKMVPPSIEEIQDSLLQTMYSRFQAILTNERLAERLKSYSEKMALPDWLKELDHETLATLFASVQFPDFFRHQSIQEPKKEAFRDRENFRRPRGGGGFGGGGRGRPRRESHRGEDSAEFFHGCGRKGLLGFGNKSYHL